MRLLITVVCIFVAAVGAFTLNALGFSYAAAVLVVLSASFWFWRIRLSYRFWLGITLGIFADSISLFPFGTYIILFVALGVITEILQEFFSDIGSSLTQVVSFGVLVAAFFISAPFIGKVLSMLV